MPNHCANRLVITGSVSDRAQFERYARGRGPAWDGKTADHECVVSNTGVCMICTVKDEDLYELDLNKFAPVPATFLLGKAGQDAYNSGGYEWVCQNWGTKWGCYDTAVSNEKTKLVYHFQTAWSPFNNAVFEAMSQKFPNLKFELKFAERGAAYYGTRVAKNGKIIKEQKVGDRPKSKVMRGLWNKSG